jgi:hypothetical protein
MLGRLIIELSYYIYPSRATKRFQCDFGDAVNTSFDIAHNLSTLDVVVAIRLSSGSYASFSPASIERPSMDMVRVVCAAPPGLNALRAIVFA